MNGTVILAAGDFPRKGGAAWKLLVGATRVVACDSAADAYRRRFRKWPTVIIGDLDSFSRPNLFPVSCSLVPVSDQETNDLTKAVHYATENFPDETRIHILAATGRSEAHTIGNVSLLMEYAKSFPQLEIDMVSDYSTIFAMTDSDTLHIGEGRRISIFSPDPTLRVKSTGLRWKTDNVVFDNWWKASLNVADDDAVKLEFNHKSLALVILD